MFACEYNDWEIGIETKSEREGKAGQREIQRGIVGLGKPFVTLSPFSN